MTLVQRILLLFKMMPGNYLGANFKGSYICDNPIIYCVTVNRPRPCLLLQTTFQLRKRRSISGNHLHFKLMWHLWLCVFKEKRRKRKSWDTPGLDHTGWEEKGWIRSSRPNKYSPHCSRQWMTVAANFTSSLVTYIQIQNAYSESLSFYKWRNVLPQSIY